MADPKPVKRLNSILLKYGLTNSQIYPCSSLYKKVAAYRVSTDKGTFLLKPYKGSNSLRRISFRLESLKNNDFISMPEWLHTVNGERWITKNGRHYYVTEWVEGTRLGEAEDYEKLGETIARLHIVSRRPTAVRPSFTLREIERFRKHHHKFTRYLPAIQNLRKPIGAWFHERGDECRRLAEEAWDTLRQPDVRRLLWKEKPSVIHGDVTRPNIIVNPGGLYLVDWERARLGSAYYEVAKTLNNVTDYSVDRMKAFLDGYEKYNPITPEERLIIASFFRLPREVWISARQVRKSNDNALFSTLKETWPMRLDAIRWLDEWAKKPQSTVHGLSSVSLKRSATASSLANHIEAAYPLEIRNIAKIRDVYRLQSAEGLALCVKSYPIPEPEVRFIAEVMIHLAEAGFRYGPRIIKTRNQALWAIRREKAYMITNWVRGRSPDLSVRAEWQKAIRTLAEFHHHAELPNIADVPSARNRVEQLPEMVSEYRSQLLAYPSMKNRSDCVSLCDEAIRHLGDQESIEAVKHEASVRAIVHGDYNYPNLVMDRKRAVHLIDFENTSLKARMTDLAHILHRNVAWKCDDTLRWIEYYDRYRPLGSGDRHLLYALLHVPYPVVRAIRLRKDVQKIRNALPPPKTIDQYISSLSKII